MSNLLQLSSSPNKSKSSINIYFSSHPKDFDKYSLIITNYIYKYSNVNWTIWYRNPSICKDDIKNYIIDLSEMKLFIIPVTYRLLVEENFTIKEDLPFALKQNISVLPILFEEVPLSLYKKVFKNIQYLKAYDSDLTELAYDDKLKNFLSAILFDENTIKKINAAFDAYIFLSYRKKDRVYAQEIMHIIHENPICRDIAIWYDEFLTPGENFNTELKEMIKKCDLFTLVVTPNLLENPNYIIEEEYPIAKDLKPIIAAEVIQTDRKQFNEIFSEYTEYLKVYEKSKLWDAILTAINKIAVSTKNTFPEHEFFVGLAYLSGINVEKNHQKAVLLIESAANNGVIEASKKLVQMYLYGDGIKRDFKKAIYWQKKYISLLKKRFHKESYDVKNACSICMSQIELGDFYKNLLGNKLSIEKAVKSYTDAKNICERILLHKNDDLDIMNLLSTIYIKLGDISENSKLFYQKAFDLRKYIVDKSNSVKSKRDFVLVHIRLGDSLEKGDALSYYKSALILANQIIDLDKSIEMKRIFSLIHYKLGKEYLSDETFDFCKAEKFLIKYRRLQKNIVKLTNSNNDKKFLAVSYQILGMLYLKDKQLMQKAKNNFLHCAKIRDTLLQDVATPEAIKDSMRAYKNLGMFFLENDPKLALFYFEKALKIITGLSKFLRTEKDYHYIMDLSIQIWELSRSKKAINSALNAISILSKMNPNDKEYKILYDKLKHQ